VLYRVIKQENDNYINATDAKKKVAVTAKTVDTSDIIISNDQLIKMHHLAILFMLNFVLLHCVKLCLRIERKTGNKIF